MSSSRYELNVYQLLNPKLGDHRPLDGVDFGEDRPSTPLFPTLLPQTRPPMFVPTTSGTDTTTSDVTTRLRLRERRHRRSSRLIGWIRRRDSSSAVGSSSRCEKLRRGGVFTAPPEEADPLPAPEGVL